MESAPVAGSRAGRYLFLRQLTSSFVGALWEARCEAAESQLLALARVVKLPADVDAEVSQTLAEAAWDSLELDDDSVVHIADAVFGTGWFALVHDHHEGDTLRTMQRRVQERKSAVPVPVALRIVLDAAHAIKTVADTVAELGVPWKAATIDPGSLLVCDDGRTRLLDGFVGHLVPDVRHMAKESDSLAYAAPEQFKDTSVNDEASQVFRLGIIAWELVTSKRLLVGSKPVMQRRLESPIIRADRVVRVGNKAPEKVAKVIEKALRVDPKQRFASVADFQKALSDAADGIAHQEEVVQFADALVGRESTLARLVMDKPQRLSDAIKSVRPTADVAKSFAAHVRSAAASGTNTETSPKGTRSKKSKKSGFGSASRLKTGPAPDALFGAVPRVQVPQVQPPAVPPRALATPEPARRMTPAAMPRAVASAAPAATGLGTTGSPRGRMKTLVGLADDFARPNAAQQAAVAAPPPAPIVPPPAPAPLPVAAPAPVPTPEPAPTAQPILPLAAPPADLARSPIAAESPSDADRDWDSLIPPDQDPPSPAGAHASETTAQATPGDEPDTLSYSADQFKHIVAELEPRKELESGPRLASKPPPAGVHAGFDDIDDEVTRIAASTAEVMAASEAKLRAELAQVAQQRAAEKLAAEKLAAEQRAAEQHAAGHTRASAAQPAGPAPAQAAGKQDRKLLVLALFFAGTTLMLGVLAAGLFVRAQAAEQTADALAAAPMQTSTVEANAAEPKQVEAAAGKAQTNEANEKPLPIEPEEVSAEEPEAPSNQDTEDPEADPSDSESSPTAEEAQPQPQPQPVVRRKPRPRPRATAPRAKAKTRYVPSDI